MTSNKPIVTLFLIGALSGTLFGGTAHGATQIVGGQGQIAGGLYIDGSTIYFNQTDGSRGGTDVIKSVSTSGGPVTTVVTVNNSYTGDGSCSSLLIDGSNLYGFIGGYAPGYVWTAPKNTVNGSPTILTSVYGGGLLAQTSTQLFLTENFGSIYTMPKDASRGSSSFGGSVGWIRGNTCDGTDLYTQDYFSHEYYMTNMITGATRDLGINGPHEFGAFTDANYLYFGGKNSNGDDIEQYTKSGEFIRNLVAANVSGIYGSDGTNVYYYDSVSQAIDSISVNGGTPSVVLSLPQSSFGAVAISNNVMYYVDPTHGSADYRIDSMSLSAPAVPEPASLGLLGGGLAGLLLKRHRK